MKKLWSKEKTALDPIVEAFETKDDLVVDQKLIPFDVQGSLVHAKMLAKIGILSKDELGKIEEGLEEILKLYRKGKFQLGFGEEDMHTKIENYLTENYGSVGEKIHTGRSRNDQILTVTRLFSKDKLEEIQKLLADLIADFTTFSQKYGDIPMPGYTHMQKAMPSSVALWAGSFKDSLQDDLVLVKAAATANNQSPLGSAAGYGSPIKLDKSYSAKLLGFEKVQNNPLYCQNSRGKVEAAIVASLISVLLTINKFASDVLLFTMQEFQFFTVSDALLTGSSMLPQKKNVDVAELLRSKVHVVLGYYTTLVSLSSNLISGYNRDLQDSKKPLIESLETTHDSIKVASILLKNLTPNTKILQSAISEDMLAANKAYTLVTKGMTFRKAYEKVKKEIT